MAGSVALLILACVLIGSGQGGTSGPLVAGVILLIGIHYETGRLFPETDHIDLSTDSTAD